MAFKTMVDRQEVEWLDGRPQRKMSPKTRHAWLQHDLANLLERCAVGEGAVGTEWRFRVGGADGTKTLFVPDVAYLSFERLRALPENQREEPPFAPDIAVEVRSPGDKMRFLNQKIARYLATGALLVLDVDPVKRTIRAVDALGERHFDEADEFESAAVPWLRFSVADAFRRLDLLK